MCRVSYFELAEATPEKELKGIRNLVLECIFEMTSNGEEIPKSISLKKFSGKFMVRVPPEIYRHLSI